MNWSFQSDRPIYIQLKEQLRLLIISGAYPPGMKMPSVRDMASDASVNPNTLQKALSELERDGLVYTQRTNGRFVTEDEEMIKQAKKEMAIEQIRIFFEKMKSMGFDKKETLDMVTLSIGEVE
jgi:GntR family transcriptional regulator